MGEIRIIRCSPRQFRHAAEDWLLQQEAQNSIVLGLLDQLVTGNHAYEEPIYLAVVYLDGQLCGCAYRTPPFKLGMTDMPDSCIEPLVTDIQAFYGHVPQIFGQADIVNLFADTWCRRFGGTAKAGERQRIHRLDRVCWPSKPALGAMRAASASEAENMVRWGAAFAEDAGLPAIGNQQRITQLIQHSDLFVWEVQESPVSMAAVVGRSNNLARIGYVYTPPASRSKGFASILVATLSQRVLDGGVAGCCLFTDLANPISNAIYARVGYQAVDNVVDIHLLTEHPAP